MSDENDDFPHSPPPEVPPVPPPPGMPPHPPLPPFPPGTGRRSKNITIRGIETEIYDQFSKNVKMLGMNIGDAITKMMKDVLTDFDETFPDLSASTLSNGRELPRIALQHHENLSVSAEDLREAKSQILFQHIDNLTIESDVTRELFLRHIRFIQHCDVVRMPSILPKLLVYSKIQYCDELEIYEVENLEEEDSTDDK